MLNLKIILAVLTTWGCHEKTTHIEVSPDDRHNCRITEVKDTSLYPGLYPSPNVIGYKFICENYIKEIDLLENNPWRNVKYPILSTHNPYIKFNSEAHYKKSHREGFIYFDLKLTGWDSVRRHFNISSDQNPDTLIFTYAKVDCRTQSYLPQYVLTNYWLSAEGVMDTSRLKDRITFFLENQIKIYEANGETAFNLITNEYVSTDAKIDSTKHLLFFRTYRVDSLSTYTGFEIHQILNNSLLHKFETDSNFIVSEPDLYGNYAFVEEYKAQIPRKPGFDVFTPYRTFVYDISGNQFRHWIYPKGYKFRFQEISGNNLIYNFGDDEYTPMEYDTMPILSLNAISF